MRMVAAPSVPRGDQDVTDPLYGRQIGEHGKYPDRHSEGPGAQQRAGDEYDHALGPLCQSNLSARARV